MKNPAKIVLCILLVLVFIQSVHAGADNQGTLIEWGGCMMVVLAQLVTITWPSQRGFAIVSR